jgi:hypothetical protein
MVFVRAKLGLASEISLKHAVDDFQLGYIGT